MISTDTHYKTNIIVLKNNFLPYFSAVSVNPPLAGGQQVPQFYSGICAQTTMELGMIRLWGKNFAKQQEEWITSSSLCNYDFYI